MSKPKVSIRPFRTSDLERILAIERASCPRAPYSRKLFLELYQECGELFVIAKSSRRIAGYIVTFAGRKKAEIVSIAVEPRFRKLGVGSTLMAYTLRELKKRRIERVELMVRASDHGTAAFYRRFGFRRVRRVPRYYEDGGDALLMTMSLVG